MAQIIINMDEKKYWWKSAKIYELYVDKFAGDFKGLTQKLDYFNFLGINCLHILPHYKSPMIDDGYDVSSHTLVRESLGTIEDVREMIREAHKRGLKIIIDFVLNHVSNEHAWFLEAKKSRTNPKYDYFLWSEDGSEHKDATNAFPDIKQSNWIKNEKTGNYYYATFYPEQPDLNWDNPQVVAEILQIMDFWCEIGVDGFRLDAAPYLIKRDQTDSKGLPETHQVLKTLRAHFEHKYPEVILLAEVHMSIEDSKKFFGSGDECHMVYHFPMMENMWLAIKRGDFEIVRRIALKSSDIPDNCQWATFLRNHDEISLFTLTSDETLELLDFLDPKRLYFFQKLGKTSMRIASVFEGDKKKILEAEKLLYSILYAPILYYGDEIGILNLPLQEGIIDTRKYVRGTFDWDEVKRQREDPDSLLNLIANIIKTAGKVDVVNA